MEKADNAPTVCLRPAAARLPHPSLPVDPICLKMLACDSLSISSFSISASLTEGWSCSQEYTRIYSRALDSVVGQQLQFEPGWLKRPLASGMLIDTSEALNCHDVLMLAFLHTLPSFLSFGRLIVHMQAELWPVMLLPLLLLLFAFMTACSLQAQQPCCLAVCCILLCCHHSSCVKVLDISSGVLWLELHII